MRGFVLMLLALLTSCSDARDLRPEPFDYHGLQLWFPKGTVDVQMPEAGLGPYARLSPSGLEKQGRYFIDLGRPRPGTYSSGLLRLGFVSVTKSATKIDLGDDYVMYCEGKLPEVQSCGVLLRELPNAGLNFVIGSKPDVPSARKAVIEAEAYLRAAKQRKKESSEA